MIIFKIRPYLGTIPYNAEISSGNFICGNRFYHNLKKWSLGGQDGDFKLLFIDERGGIYFFKVYESLFESVEI